MSLTKKIKFLIPEFSVFGTAESQIHARPKGQVLGDPETTENVSLRTGSLVCTQS